MHSIPRESYEQADYFARRVRNKIIQWGTRSLLHEGGWLRDWTTTRELKAIGGILHRAASAFLPYIALRHAVRTARVKMTKAGTSSSTPRTSSARTSKRSSTASGRMSRSRTSTSVWSGDTRHSWTSSTSSKSCKTRISRSTARSSLSLRKVKPTRRCFAGRRLRWWWRRERVVAVGDLGKPGLIGRLVCKLRRKER